MLLRLCGFSISRSVFDPSDTQIFFAERAGKGRKEETHCRKMCGNGGKKKFRGSERKWLQERK